MDRLQIARVVLIELLLSLYVLVGMVTHVQSPEKGHNFCASVNIPFIFFFNGRILVTKDTVPSNISKGYIINSVPYNPFSELYWQKESNNKTTNI